MNITRRLYSYPVLSEDKDDYVSSYFDASVSCVMNGVNKIKIEVDTSLKNDAIDDLIREGMAEYVIHIECSNTGFRTTMNFDMKKYSIDIPSGRIRGKLEMIALIVLKENITNFVSLDWDEDYAGISFDLVKGNILAYKNLQDFEIVKNFEEFVNATSIFKVCKRLTDVATPMDVELDYEKIAIRLNENDYNLYSKYCRKIQFQSILNSMIIFPALVYVFEELKQESGMEYYEGQPWFVSISRAYEKRGVNFKNELNDDSKHSLQLAQEAMELPLSKSLAALETLFDSADEDEEDF